MNQTDRFPHQIVLYKSAFVPKFISSRFIEKNIDLCILIEIEFGERATPNIESKSNCVLLELESSISSNTITSF